MENLTELQPYSVLMSVYGGENADADQILSVQLAFIFCVHVNTS